MTSERRVLNNRFRLLVTLGKGGMGSVWLAEDLLLERVVALKELTPPGGDPEHGRQRALQEARALARVRHPAIVPIHDVFFVSDDPWIVMEYIEGRSLHDLIERRLMDDATVAMIGLHVLRGLVAIHQAGVVHRDVKPDNILVASDSAIVLVDFGIAKIAGDKSLTRRNNVVGTPEYIAPERLTPNAAVGAPADLWSLGVTLYRAIEGDSPFRRDSEYGPGATAHAILHEEPRAFTRHSELSDIIARTLIKDPEVRADVNEVIAALSGILRQSGDHQIARTGVGAGEADTHGYLTRPEADVRLGPAGPPQRSPEPSLRRAAGSPWRNRDPAAPSQHAGHDTPDTTRRMPANDVRDLIRSVGPDVGVAMLLAIPAADATAILAEYMGSDGAELLQGIANARPATASAIMRMLPSQSAARMLTHLRSVTSAEILASLPTAAAIRILDRASDQTAARAIKDMPVGDSVRLLRAMTNWRAAAVLAMVKPVTTAAVLRTDADFAAAVLRLFAQADRERITRYMMNPE